METYEETKGFLSPELYALRLQIRKAGVSVPSNIAEGQGRKPTPEFRHHLSTAHGSLREIETQVLISENLGNSRRGELRGSWTPALRQHLPTAHCPLLKDGHGSESDGRAGIEIGPLAVL